MHRFFVEDDQIKDKKIDIVGEDVNHIANVLRLNLGDEITICNRQGREYCCIIEIIDKDHIETSILSMNESSNELNTKIYLFQGIPKQDKMELIIQKSIELGVYEIIPVVMSRTVVKLNSQKEEKKLARWNKIALSAAKQSNRGIVPKVAYSMSFHEAVQFAKELDHTIVPYEKATEEQTLKKTIEKIDSIQSLGIFIGPEGGFDDQEIDQLTKMNAEVITLGKRILRTETAGLAILSIMMYHMEVDKYGSS